MTGPADSLGTPPTIPLNRCFGKSQVGILSLDEKWPAQMPVGSLADPDALPSGSSAMFVPGATLQRILETPGELIDTYIGAAQALEACGASLITSNCGYSVLFQNELANACRVTVVSSSLLLLSDLLETCQAQQRVAILCFDSERLEHRHLEAAGADRHEERIDIYGLEGMNSWKQVTGPGGRYNWQEIGQDLQSIAGRIAADNKHSAILIECCAFLPFSSAISKLSRRPVYDLFSSIDRFFSNKLEPRKTNQTSARFEEISMVRAPLRPRQLNSDDKSTISGIR